MAPDITFEVLTRSEKTLTQYYHLHSHPELSKQEHDTLNYIQQQLHLIGIQNTRQISGGLVCTIEGAASGFHLAVRAEMDALPLEEKTGVPYASKHKGVMHACGHDFHMACLLTLADIVHSHRSKLKGKVTLIFQPSEEQLPGGARQMLEHGLFADSAPDLIIAQHVFPDLPAGHFGFRAGEYMASGDEIFITFRGRGGHAALPHQSDDLVMAMAQTLVALQNIRSRKIDQTIPFVLSFGKAVANGAPNVLPSEASLEGTMRTLSELWRKEAKTLIHSVVKQCAKAAGCIAEVSISEGYPVLINSSRFTQILQRSCINLFAEAKVHLLPIRMTTDDFSYYAQKFPAVYYRIGVGNSSGVLHTAEFLPDTSALNPAIHFLAHLAFTLAAELG